MHSLRKSKGDTDSAIDWLFDHRYASSSVLEHGVDPYFACGGDGAALLKDYASHTYVDLDNLDDSRLNKFFTSSHVSSMLNVVELNADMIADVVMRVIPRSWKGVDVAPVSSLLYDRGLVKSFPNHH